MAGIITSLLDTDLYKFTMMQCVFHHCADVKVKYKNLYRYHLDLKPYKTKITEEILKLCDLKFTKEELYYLSNLTYIKSDFIDFLANFQLNAQHIHVTIADNNLSICIDGPWLTTIMFEVPVLAIICEVYFKENFPQPVFTDGMLRLADKINLIRNLPDNQAFRFSDFGTRRRFSKHWQSQVVATLHQELPNHFIGTSNVALAKAMNLTPIGTMAHEYLQAFQAISPKLEDSQKDALKIWLKEFQGQLGIALSDVITIDAFLRDFDLSLATRYTGVRHDSGDPIIWAEKVIRHYEKLNIDPRTKTLVFSDNLTIPKAIAIYNKFKGTINVVFGIGTNLTNDLGYTPLDHIIKMVRANDKPVAKISDAKQKIVCEDLDYIAKLQMAFKVNN